jgi:phage FluMu protein Com
MSRRQQETHESSMNNDGVPEREPPLPRDSIKSSTLQHMGHMIQCRHAPKGCGKLLTKDELPAHLEKCPFERCKEQLANGRIDPIIKYFKKQVRGVGESSVMCGERPARVFGECPILAPPPLFCRHPGSAEACPH